MAARVISNAGSGNANTNSVVDFLTYEDYLDSQITPLDMFYLEDKELARQLVELGYRGNGEPLKREEFEARKKLIKGNAVNEAVSGQNSEEDGLVSLATEQFWKNDDFLKELAEREEPNKSGKMMVSFDFRSVVSGH